MQIAKLTNYQLLPFSLFWNTYLSKGKLTVEYRLVHNTKQYGSTTNAPVYIFAHNILKIGNRHSVSLLTSIGQIAIMWIFQLFWGTQKQPLCA